MRPGFVGGASSLQAVPGGVRMIDSPGIDLKHKAEASSQAQVLDALRGADTNADWFYLSPPASYGAQVPGRRTGNYRTGDDVLLTNSASPRSAATISPSRSSTRSSDRRTTRHDSPSRTDLCAAATACQGSQPKMPFW
jgi:putative NADH-flavin reductase